MSGFPDTVDQFISKLDGRSVPYVIQDEAICLANGAGKKELEHDNVRKSSVEIWTARNKTGMKISSGIVVSTSGSPWKTVVRVACPSEFSSLETVYATYETTGDQMEAKDINDLQQSITSTQSEVLRHIKDSNIHVNEGIVDGGSF